jgi:hypothetical protein
MAFVSGRMSSRAATDPCRAGRRPHFRNASRTFRLTRTALSVVLGHFRDIASTALTVEGNQPVAPLIQVFEGHIPTLHFRVELIRHIHRSDLLQLSVEQANQDGREVHELRVSSGAATTF